MSDNGIGHNEGPLGAVSPTEMYGFLGRYEDYLYQRKQVNKVGKELRADIEKAGVPLPAWDLFVKLRDEAGVVRERNDAAYRQLMLWDKKPVGLQASMDLTSSQGSPELNVGELKTIDNEGFEAGKSGKKREANPYTPGTEAAQRFDQAWLRGQAEIASTLTDDKAERAAARAAANVTSIGDAPRRRGRPPGSKNRQAALN